MSKVVKNLAFGSLVLGLGVITFELVRNERIKNEGRKQYNKGYNDASREYIKLADISIEKDEKIDELNDKIDELQEEVKNYSVKEKKIV